MSRRASDGRGLLGAFGAAVDNLAAHVDEVNALNVFPVPDGDTGSNMLATVKAALAEAEAVVEPTADRIAQAISYGALMGARGNSGVIASQIFRGMAEGLGGKQRFDGQDLAHSLNQGAATAYRAVVKPVEGTILTVIREASLAASEKAEAGGDLGAVLAAAVAGARRSRRQDAVAAAGLAGRGRRRRRRAGPVPAPAGRGDVSRRSASQDERRSSPDGRPRARRSRGRMAEMGRVRRPMARSATRRCSSCERARPHLTWIPYAASSSGSVSRCSSPATRARSRSTSTTIGRTG